MAIIERLSIHLNLNVNELKEILEASQKEIVPIRSNNCLAKIIKGKAITQCMRLRKKGVSEPLCDAHLKKATSATGLAHGMFIENATNYYNNDAPLYADEDAISSNSKSIEVRLMIHRGREYLHDFISSRMYDPTTHRLVGILTEKGVLEFDKKYLL